MVDQAYGAVPTLTHLVRGRWQQTLVERVHHDRDRLAGTHASALQHRSTAIVHRHDAIGDAARQTLLKDEHAMYEAPPKRPGEPPIEHLRRQVVHVEDETCPAKPREEARQDEEVGRIRDMNHVVAAASVEACERECREHDEAQVLSGHRGCAGASLVPYRQAADPYAIDDLAWCLAGLAQADDVDLETPIERRGRLALNPRLADRVARMNDHAQAPYPGTSPYLPLRMVTG